jgi:Xaa-Pro dipeptidase
MEADDAREAGWEQEIIGYSDTDDPWAFIEKRTGARLNQIQSIAVEKEHLNVSRFEELQKLYPEATFYPAEPLLHTLRLVKDDQEIKMMEKACKLVDYAVEVGVNELAEGKTELDIVAAIEYEIRKKGGAMAFSPIVLAGPKAASPHGVPGEAKLKKGEFVLFDLGVSFQGYCSDITRTVAFGEVNEEQRKIYETVLKAQEAAISLIRPGIQAKDLDSAARRFISGAGYGDYFPHRLGHGLGIGAHEYPSINGTNELELKPGMVFTVEPGIYIPGVAGVRIEDDVAVAKDGVSVLTKYPKTLQIVE